MEVTVCYLGDCFEFWITCIWWERTDILSVTAMCLWCDVCWSISQNVALSSLLCQYHWQPMLNHLSRLMCKAYWLLRYVLKTEIILLICTLHACMPAKQGVVFGLVCPCVHVVSENLLIRKWCNFLVILVVVSVEVTKFWRYLTLAFNLESYSI